MPLQRREIVETVKHGPDDLVFLPQDGLRRAGVHLDLLAVAGGVLAEGALQALRDADVIDD